jgi:hypothetical protein
MPDGGGGGGDCFGQAGGKLETRVMRVNSVLGGGAVREKDFG